VGIRYWIGGVKLGERGMSGINWCSVDAAFRRGGLAAGLRELDIQGHVVVPKAPTYEMVTEGLHPTIPGSVSEIYKEMIKARPEVVL
jgi:hypothetical protein